MDIRCGISGLDAFIEEEMARVRQRQREIAEEAIERAKADGNYHDHTGRLKRSYEAEVNDSGVTLENTAPYASNVESKGGNVLISAVLWAESELKKEFEK